MIGGQSVPIDRVLADLALIVGGDPWEETTVRGLHDDEGLDYSELETPGVRDIQKKVGGEDILIVRWTAPLNVHDEMLFDALRQEISTELLGDRK